MKATITATGAQITIIGEVGKHTYKVSYGFDTKGNEVIGLAAKNAVTIN